MLVPLKCKHRYARIAAYDLKMKIHCFLSNGVILDIRPRILASVEEQKKEFEDRIQQLKG